MSAIKQAIKTILPRIALDIAGSMQLYRKAHGVFPNILFPKTFNEKVVCRSLFDNRRILRQFADKFTVRAYVSKRLGPQVLPELYWVTETPSDIPFDRLPKSFVVKPTHGAGWVRIVRDKAALDMAELVRQCEIWLSQNFYRKSYERIYKDIVPRILVEELIDDGSGNAPVDYKFMVFHGRVELIAVIVDRFKNTRGYFLDRDWKTLSAGLAEGCDCAHPTPAAIPKPPHLDEMIRASEILGKDLDFVRPDFYDTPEKIYFGELTTTPGAGLARYAPSSFDEYLGKFW